MSKLTHDTEREMGVKITTNKRKMRGIAPRQRPSRAGRKPSAPIIYLSVPGLDGRESREYYATAFERLPPLRIRGYFGVTEGSEASNKDVVLLLYDRNPLEPVARLVMRRKDLKAMIGSLENLIKTRFGG